ncbi:tRNA lysidine(34) synthetase TilS [Flammeovirga kamogawensis]|uniref:tRNA(Ile)-lysidine synthase n=1 Tax=Flammeovirga kamogawensis TaxID=373891 RepID=A0ABX8GY19_9BACT|nr:tRNA lysidine(34) synthetase TilS [Flammeovirga kamogawensis]MBB6461261.1 tRNA(Ile)-lysidine synthase [Flammeovirga kamogawensis]QWG07820.1 tRNA lysidine(34) synthetase TilS [Flammeovirga kamogawensis]TRX69625.1 tRNA lysidine(34) synthetase TilS [Flammeovirga kamogawensis]
MNDNPLALEDQFLTYLKSKGLDISNIKLLLAFSGGVDSVGLALLLLKHDIYFEIAHMNFQLRGEDSHGDEQFVKDFSSENNIICHIKKVDTTLEVQKSGKSTQMVARDLRYDWFKELKKQYNLDYISTAHHRSDSVETILFNLIKGTGIEGLHGIQFIRNTIIRPLLFTSKDQIKRYVEYKKQNWREDKSNQINKYARNLIRNKIIPLMREINPAVEKSIDVTSNKLSKIENVFFSNINEITSKYWKKNGDTILIDFEKYSHLEDIDIILFYQLKKYRFDFDTALNIIQSYNLNSLKFFSIDKDYVIYTHNNTLVLENNNEKELIIRQSLKIDFKEGFYSFDTNSYQTSVVTINSISSIENASIYISEKYFPITIREVNKGDKIRPFGMKNGRKKVFDLLQDENVPSYLRKKTLVIVSCNEEILSVVGIRNSEVLRIEKFPVTLMKICF